MDLQSFLERDESKDIEFKKASDTLPDSLWETYSAMANTSGGYIILGISESKKGVDFTGVTNIPKMKKLFWDNINNPQKVSKCILSDSDVLELKEDNKTALVICVPVANRTEKPVYLKNNPLRFTYKRNHEGDYKCSEDVVKRMLADATQDSRDSVILPNTSIKDLDRETVTNYRSYFSSVKPQHAWLELSEEEFLKMLQVIRKDRSTGEEGLTVAGLLAFGKYQSIRDFFPGLHLDFRELDPDQNERWIDRVYLDGSWPGNLYQFYRKVYPKLTENLKIPFKLEKVGRVSDSPVHVAMREALANAIIHAEFGQDTNIIILKYPSYFEFKNSGLLRIPLEQVYRGGESDCRNKVLQTIFDMVGIGEKAGSGISKILHSWKQQHWKAPLIEEEHERGTTRLVLPMLSLVSEETIMSLKEIFGDKLDSLDHNSRTILVAAKDEISVSHIRLQKLLVGLHNADISQKLRELIDLGFLLSTGNTRGKTYFINNDYILTELDSSENNGNNSGDNGNNSGDNGNNSGDNGNNSGDTKQLEGKLSQSKIDQLREIVKEKLGNKKRANPDLVKKTIIELLENTELSTQEISDILEKNPEYVQKQYLKPLLGEKRIEQTRPSPNDPKQRYKITPDSR